MAEDASSVMLETDITTLEEALYAQQQLLQKLSVEVEVEREFAATAASEALSMILRLQGEKASLKMEASQYKRMAEEKMCHAEEALAIFEDLIYQREMEIASLEFQVQAYRYKLLSMGCNDLGVYENKYPENLLGQRSEHLFGEKGVNSNVWRFNSLPQAMTKDQNHKKSVLDRIKSASPALDALSSRVEDILVQEIDDSEKKPGSCAAKESVDLNTCWEQIKKWDERVKEIADSKESVRNRRTILKGGTWSPSEFSQVTVGTSNDPVTEVNISISNQVKNEENSQERQGIVDSACPSSVHDVFEVPQTSDAHKAFESWKKKCKLNLECESRPGKPNLAAEETVESSSKFEAERVKAMLFSVSHDRKLHKPRSVSNLGRVPPVFPSVDTGNSQIEYQQLNWRIERLEKARTNTRQEITAGGGGEEELNLLKEICEQLKSMESEMKSWRPKKSFFHLPDEPSLDPLREAMIYFWI